MWRIHLGALQDLALHSDTNVQWEAVTQKGTLPGNISHHKAAVFGHKAVIFGGIQNNGECEEAYEFDTEKVAWNKLKQSGDIPKSRDDHSLAQVDESSFIIFGGFVAGSRVNECYMCTKNGTTLDWKCLGEKSPVKPAPRASQSIAFFKGKLYIFGGMDEDNSKFCDLWEFDLATETYKEITCPPNTPQPGPRSGHSAVIFKDKMYIFGGILELTKELNEMCIFDFKNGHFNIIGGDGQPNEDLNRVSSHQRNREEESPTLRRNTLNASKKATVHGHDQGHGSPTK